MAASQMTRASARPVPPRLDALTGLRGLAAWLVVLYHARLSLAGWLPGWLIEALGHGYLAVDLFFMLSGFVLWLNYADRLRGGGLAAVPEFWWRRLARIWPLHGAVLAVLVAFALLLRLTGRDASGYPFAELPLHLLLVQNWSFTPELSWNHPAWSISTEMAAYLMFPLLVLAIGWERMRPWVLVLITGVLAALLASVFALAGESGLGGQIPRLGLIRCLIEFAMGMVLANLWTAWRGKARRGSMALVAGLAAMAGLALGWVPQTLAIPLGLAALLLALALADGGPAARLLGIAPLKFLGEISYATYLVHFPLFIFAKLLLVGEDLLISPAGFAAYCAVLLALSAGLYRLLELPAQRWLNRARPRLGAIA